MFFKKSGMYGTSYRQRAMITWYGLGANRPQDAVYPTSEGPDLVKKYSGANKYVMHFNKGEMPPANGFWSITMYDKALLLRAQPHQSLYGQLSATSSRPTPTDRSTSTSSTIRRARTRSRTGCPRRPVRSC